MKIYIHIITRWTQRWATLKPSSSIYYYNKIGSQVLSNTCCHNIIGPYIIYFKVDEELADWWETFSTASDDTRTDMLQSVKAPPRAVKADGTPVARKRPRRRRKPAGDAPASGDSAD